MLRVRVVPVNIIPPHYDLVAPYLPRVIASKPIPVPCSSVTISEAVPVDRLDRLDL